MSLHLACIYLNSKQRAKPDIKKLHTSNKEDFMKEKYFVIICSLIINTIVFAQVDFPSEPNQAPIGGLGLLAAGGAALAYKKLKK